MSVSPPHRAHTLATQLRDRTARAQVHIDSIPILAIAIAVTAIGSAVAWLLIGHPPLNGIDDAAITRSYAENIANGYGYVYNIGGERVEGATSVLWTIVVTLAYLVTSAPEYLILAISFGLTVAALYAALNIAELVARYLNAPSAMFRWLMVVALLAAPSFFLWTVWTMMEVALWSAILLWLIWRIILLFQDEQQQHWPLLVAAALMPLARPEGIAMAAGLLALAGVFSHRRRLAWIAFGVVLIVFASMTLARLAYFGYVFPNTYYAKVSSDHLANIKAGLQYLFAFVSQAPFASVFILLWVLATAATIVSRKFYRSAAVLVLAAAILGVLLTYVMLGGDIFPFWRFYQPIIPILPAVPVALVAIALEGLPEFGWETPPRALICGLISIYTIGFCLYALP